MVQLLRLCTSTAEWGFDPWSGNLRSHMSRRMAIKKKKSIEATKT